MKFSSISWFLSFFLFFQPVLHTFAYDGGPVVKLSASTGSKSIDEIQQLRIATYNVYNLLEPRGSTDPFKSSKDLLGVAKTILDTSAQIVVLEEVENIRILNFFNREYLRDQYQTLLIEGNDERGIDVGFLIRKDVPYDVVAYSHKNLKTKYMGKTVPLFSRDLPVLLFYKKNITPSATNPPLFAIAGTHFKSMRDNEGDPNSTKLRSLQALGASQIIQKFENAFKNRLPMILMGDFNNDSTHAPEFEPLRKVGLRDVFDLTSPPLSPSKRITYGYFPQNGPAEYKQLDAIWMNPYLQSKKALGKAGVIPYRDQKGKIIPFPRSYEERKKLPSDHFMVAADLIIKKL